MSDDRLERALSDAIADLAGTSTPVYLNDILERTSRTRQRPWWTFRGRYLAMTPTLKFAAAAGLAFVLGIGLAPLILPSGNDAAQAPAAAGSPDPTTTPEAAVKPSFFTGTASSGSNLEPGSITFDGGVRKRGMVFGGYRLAATDPRISGTGSTSVNLDEFTGFDVLEGSPDGRIGTSVDRIENEHGAWQGVVTELNIGSRTTISGWYVGEGDFEGLHAYLIWEGGSRSTPDVHGIITAEGPVDTPAAP